MQIDLKRKSKIAQHEDIVRGVVEIVSKRDEESQDELVILLIHNGPTTNESHKDD
jgi:hypothetical protein